MVTGGQCVQPVFSVYPSVACFFTMFLLVFLSHVMLLSDRDGAVSGPMLHWLFLALAQSSVFLFHWQLSVLSSHLLQGRMGCCAVL